MAYVGPDAQEVPKLMGQVDRRMEQLEAAARRWKALEDLVAARGWPDRGARATS